MILAFAVHYSMTENRAKYNRIFTIKDRFKWSFKKFFFNWTRCLLNILSLYKSKPILKYLRMKVINTFTDKQKVFQLDFIRSW